jgi:hypothetical protein
LWIQSLGLPAVIPPPEEEKDVKTAIGAARAKQARKGKVFSPLEAPHPNHALAWGEP